MDVRNIIDGDELERQEEELLQDVCVLTYEDAKKMGFLNIKPDDSCPKEVRYFEKVKETILRRLEEERW